MRLLCWLLGHIWHPLSLIGRVEFVCIRCKRTVLVDEGKPAREWIIAVDEHGNISDHGTVITKIRVREVCEVWP